LIYKRSLFLKKGLYSKRRMRITDCLWSKFQKHNAKSFTNQELIIIWNLTNLSVHYWLVIVPKKQMAQEFKLGKVSCGRELRKSHIPKILCSCEAILFKRDVWFEYSQDKGFQMVTSQNTRQDMWRFRLGNCCYTYLGSNFKGKRFFSGRSDCLI
jgi:hypothetical protein